MRQLLVLTAALLLAVLAPAAGPARAGSPLFHTENGVAIRGYDTVAYFRRGEAVPGRPDIAVAWKGAIWRFASQDNREAFEANPRAYAPRFGGYCAYAVSRGYLAAGDPQAWEIVDGRLYLIHDPALKRVWERDVAGNLALAEANWPALLKRAGVPDR